MERIIHSGEEDDEQERNNNQQNKKQKVVCHLDDDLENDEKDKQDPSFVSEYVDDIMSYLRRIEFERKPDPLIFVDSLVRANIVNCFVLVNQDYQCTNDTLHLNVAIVDALFSRRFVFDVCKEKETFMAACLLVSQKFEEIYPVDAPELRHVFANVQVKEIVQMEKRILECLEYRLCLPTACQFLRRFSKITQSESVQHVMAKYLVELAFLHVEWLNYLPSQFSAAAVFLAKIFFLSSQECSSLSMQTSWIKRLIFQSFCTLPTLKECALLLINWFLSASSNTPYQASYNKYQRMAFHKVSLLKAPPLSVIENVFQQLATTKSTF